MLSVPFSVLIDWASFVFRVPEQDPCYHALTPSNEIQKAIRMEFGSEAYDCIMPLAEYSSVKQKPYDRAWQSKLTRAFIYASTKLPHALLQLSGQSCEAINRQGLLLPMVHAGEGLMSRIDIAFDLKTNMSPQDFVGLMSEGRTKSKSIIESSSGTTIYLGSQSSEHYTRVYRYADPHPRSAELRIEMVQRRERAKNASAAIREHGLLATAQHLWNEAGMPLIIDLEGDNPEMNLNEPRARSTANSTMMWLIKQVAPAFQKMCMEGHIDSPEQFLERYFLGIETGQQE